MSVQLQMESNSPLTDKLIKDLSADISPLGYGVYKRYAQKVIATINQHEINGKPIFPQILCKALMLAIPKGFGLKIYFTWREIRDWAYDLDKRASQQKNPKRTIRMQATVDIVIKAVTFFDCEPNDIPVIDWYWCPLCWMPVLNSNGKKKCPAHKTGSPGYQKVNRLLKKNNKLNNRTDKYDRLPVDKKRQIKKMVRLAFEYGFPDGWELLSFTKNYLLKQNPDADLSDINACLEVLAPGTVDLFNKDRRGAEFFQNDLIRYIAMNQKALLTRAECWLMLKASNENRGGHRQNAGRPPMNCKKR